jgi:hypothetical protein
VEEEKRRKMLSYGITAVHQTRMWSMTQRNMRNSYEDGIPIEDDCLKLSSIAPLYYQAIDRRVGYRKVR